MATSPVFEQTYRRYLDQIGAIEHLARAGRLGAGIDGEALVIPLYERIYKVSAARIEALDGGRVTDAVRVILARYVLNCPQRPAQAPDPWVSYREFKDAAPLVFYFKANTNKTLENHFGGRLGLLKQRCRDLGGVEEPHQSYDLSVRFSALPKVPVMLNFNDRDDLFPPACSVLYRKSAESYLDMECLAMTGTLLCGKLLGADST
jgi:hypothetical protein